MRLDKVTRTRTRYKWSDITNKLSAIMAAAVHPLALTTRPRWCQRARIGSEPATVELWGHCTRKQWHSRNPKDCLFSDVSIGSLQHQRLLVLQVHHKNSLIQVSPWVSKPQRHRVRDISPGPAPRHPGAACGRGRRASSPVHLPATWAGRTAANCWDKCSWLQAAAVVWCRSRPCLSQGLLAVGARAETRHALI